MNRFLFLFIMFFMFNSCSKDKDCNCNGLFEYPNGTRLVVPDVDCETGEPGAPPTSSIPSREAEFLGCHSEN